MRNVKMYCHYLKNKKMEEVLFRFSLEYYLEITLQFPSSQIFFAGIALLPLVALIKIDIN